MGLMDKAKGAFKSLTGRGPVSIPREQVQAYIEVCREIIARLAGGNILYPVEMNFILAIDEHCSNCVLRWNGIVLEDRDLEHGCSRLIDKFWRTWDRSFSSVAIKREMEEQEALEWQQQLYLLRLFADIDHFQGVIDAPGAQPTDASFVYSREALVFDLHWELVRLLKQEGITDVQLPSRAA